MKMAISFSEKRLNSQEIRGINIELMLYINEKNPDQKILRSEKRLMENLLDYVVSRGQIGTSEALLKIHPELKGIVRQKFAAHVEAGNAINISNYLRCFKEIKFSSKELLKIARRKALDYPNSTERKKVLELLKDKIR